MSATMLCAHQAGIRVFVTGGIGGVHRDGEDSKESCNNVYVLYWHVTKQWTLVLTCQSLVEHQWL